MSGCGFFEKDNTPRPSPLVPFNPEIVPRLIWKTSVGNGSAREYLKMSPRVSEFAIFTSSSSGVVTAVNKMNGKIYWQRKTRYNLTAGPGIGEGLVVIGSNRGDILALRQSDGCILWQTKIVGEVIANPAIASGVVIIKTTSGGLHALSAVDGHLLWALRQVEPTLMLRGSSSPIIAENELIAGFANGNLLKLNITTGELFWQNMIAIPEGAFNIERMIDIDADPLYFNHQLYAATYQGNIASLSFSSGKVYWAHNISSYTGMAADERAV